MIIFPDYLECYKCGCTTHRTNKEDWFMAMRFKTLFYFCKECGEEMVRANQNVYGGHYSHRNWKYHQSEN